MGPKRKVNNRNKTKWTDWSGPPLFLYLYWKIFQKETHCFQLPLPLSYEDDEDEEVSQQWFGSPPLGDQHSWSSLVFAAVFQLAEMCYPVDEIVVYPQESTEGCHCGYQLIYSV
ncbi:uncharacterized protein LOC129870626 isoform X2 [Solanum dulcamara]|nr:uncharacterized protein LOC129870626 isoform X2 [Solanum dulcamara]